MSEARDPASFRDPSGFVFRRDGVLYRHVGASYRDDYEQLVDSGLYAALTERGWLVAHHEVETDPAAGADAWRILRPEVVPFISYPYEWCFAQLRDAALLTLDVERLALAHGMSLKDASAYNVQFRGSRPVLIDTLSFERYREGRPWVAYRQFCQHFLAPLALASFRDPRTSDLLKAHLDGVPLDLAARLLPRRARLRFGLLSHLFLHAASQRRMAGSGRAAESFRVSRQAREGLVESLAAAVRRLRSPSGSTEWGRYYEATNYDDEAARHKASVVEAALDALAPAEVWDLGANDARFSALASERGIPTVAMDGDWRAVEGAYERSCEQRSSTLLPLKIDLTNPSPALGWHHRERSSLLDRGPADLVLALALVHHLAIGNNVPLPMLAAWFADCSRNLVIEWVPKSDSQVDRLLSSRADVFPGYDRSHFEAAFEPLFEIEDRVRLEGSERSIYRMKRRTEPVPPGR